MSNNKWYDKRKTHPKSEATGTDAVSATRELQNVRFTKAESAPGELIATWELKLREVQSFAANGVKSGSDGGALEEQHGQSVMAIMSELGQFAKEMSKKDKALKPGLARKRIGAMLIHCAELCILNGITLDAAVVDRVNELCDLDKRYDRPSSLL